jgi:conserved hypothetical protein
MEIVNKKVDFILTVEVRNANPNGDPLNGNMPRVDYDGYGEISDVAIKRKIRNRWQDMGEKIFVQSTERADDKIKSLEERFKKKFGKVDKMEDESIYSESCKEWLDVRGFGQVITFQKKSIGIRGPISISLAKSLAPVVVQTMQITRSTNGEEKEGKASDTMGSKHYIEYGVYKITGSVNCFFSEKTGFNEEDLKTLKEALRTLFVNDSSSARPEGSMSVKQLFWFEHKSKLGKVSTAKINELLEYNFDENLNAFNKYSDFDIRLNEEKLKEYGGEIKNNDSKTSEGDFSVEIIEGI